MEGFGVMVDNIAHRFVATTTLVAPSRPCACHLPDEELADAAEVIVWKDTDVRVCIAG